MSDIVVHAGDRLPLISRSFTVDGVAVDLTGATVVFKVYDPATMNVIINNSATVTSASTGTVAYSWTVGDTTALVAGNYFAQFVATSSGKNITAPNDGYLTLLVAGNTGTFTYSGDPSLRPLDNLRFLINDTDSTDVLMNDAELLHILSETGGSVYQAAHDACYSIASRFARFADVVHKTVGDLSLSRTYAQRSARYLELAERFLELANRREPPLPWAKPAALVSTRDRLVTTHNTDFYVGQFDIPPGSSSPSQTNTYWNY